MKCYGLKPRSNLHDCFSYLLFTTGVEWLTKLDKDTTTYFILQREKPVEKTSFTKLQALYNKKKSARKCYYYRTRLDCSMFSIIF